MREIFLYGARGVRNIGQEIFVDRAKCSSLGCPGGMLHGLSPPLGGTVREMPVFWPGPQNAPRGDLGSPHEGLEYYYFFYKRLRKGCFFL